jgi:hypothetical protein
MDDLLGMSRWKRGRCTSWLTGAMAAAFVAAALPAVAGAADYCVYPNQSCDPAHNVQTLEAAIDEADNANDADRIILGAGDYTAKSAHGFDYINGNAPVEIVGQGVGQTILTSPAGGVSWVLRLSAGAGSSIHDLTIRLPEKAVDGFSGLHTNSAARRIEVVEDPTQDNVPRYGVDLVEEGALEDSTVTLNGQHSTSAVFLVTPGVAVRRSALSARVGAKTWGGTIERSRVTGEYIGVSAFSDLTAITGSLIRTTGAHAFGIYAEGTPASPTVVNADGVTIVGTGQPNSFGADVGAELNPADVADISINLTNSIIRGFSAPLMATPAGAGQLKITASYSDYDPSGNYSAGNASISETNVSNVGDAHFVDAAGGDYRLLPGSPLIDTGDPATPQGLDLAGSPLVADGNGDGGARRDRGAFEFQPAPAGVGGQPAGGSGQPGGTAPVDRQSPLVSGFRATPSVFVRRTRFRYTLSEAAQVTLRIQRALPGRHGRYRTVRTLKRTGAKGPNRIRFARRIGKRSLRPGRYRAVIVATDAAGNRSTLRRTRFRVAAS